MFRLLPPCFFPYTVMPEHYIISTRTFVVTPAYFLSQKCQPTVLAGRGSFEYRNIPMTCGHNAMKNYIK